MPIRKGFINTWHMLQTTGKPLMLDRRAVSVTTSTDYDYLTVPQGERWILFSATMKNCTLSSGNSDQQLYITGPSDSHALVTDSIIYDNSASLGWANFPGGSVHDYQKHGGTPIPIYETQKLVARWGTSANKSGTAYWYVNVLKFKVGSK